MEIELGKWLNENEISNCPPKKQFRMQVAQEQNIQDTLLKAADG